MFFIVYDPQHTSNSPSVAWSGSATQPSNSLTSSNQYSSSSTPSSAAPFLHMSTSSGSSATATPNESHKSAQHSSHSHSQPSQQTASAALSSHAAQLDSLSLYPQSQHYPPYMGNMITSTLHNLKPLNGENFATKTNYFFLFAYR